MNVTLEKASWKPMGCDHGLETVKGKTEGLVTDFVKLLPQL